MQTKHHVTAGCYLVRKHGSKWQIILICRQWQKGEFSWVPPKGHVEEGETFEDAAQRETTEETGYTNFKVVCLIDTLHIKYHEDDGLMHHKDIHYFLAELVDDTCIAPNLSASEESTFVKAEWVDVDKALTALRFDDEREVLRIAMVIMVERGMV